MLDTLDKQLHTLDCSIAEPLQGTAVARLILQQWRRMAAYKRLNSSSGLQIPSWWVHREVQPLLIPLKETEHMDAHGGISLFNVVQVQLMAGAGVVWLPKYLLVLFQTTM